MATMDEIVTQFPRSMALTDAAVYRLRAPDQRVTIRDSKLSQLVLTIGPKSRAWYVHATVQRRTQRVHLGRFPILGVEDARKKALDALRKLYAGESPKSQRVQGLTLATALDKYIEGRKLRDSSAADCRGVIERHAAKWLTHPLATLTAQDVAGQYRKISAKSVSMANKLLRNLSAVARHAAVAHGAGDADLVKKARTLLGGMEALPSRDNVIPDALQAAWFAEVSKLAAPVRGLLLALALTGCRKDELRLAPSSAWDSDKRTLHIATTKSGKPHTLPVGTYLAALLDECTGDRLFNVGEHELRAAYERVAAVIGNDWTPHDLRRGLATIGARLGIDELTIKRLLNHAAQGVTQTHYIRLSVDDLRQPMQRIESHITGLWA
jgi:integrase